MATGRGRPRSTGIDDAVRAAAAEALDRDGYAGVVIEEVARRAGVSKTAVYRRWPNRRALTLVVLQDRLGRIEAPETGCTLCDVHEALVLVTEATCSLGAGTLAQLIAEGVDEQGEPIEIVDRIADRVHAAALVQAEDDLAFLRDRDLFGDLVEDERFVAAYRWALSSLHARGSRATIQALLDGEAPGA